MDNVKLEEHRFLEVLYKDTIIVSIDLIDKVVRLNSGGWYTACHIEREGEYIPQWSMRMNAMSGKTTKAKINECLSDFGIAGGVYQKKRKWYLYAPTLDNDIEFFDNIEFNYLTKN